MNAPMFWIPHLLRPWWLLAWLALPLLGWWWRAQSRRQSPWTWAVDAHLLPALLQEAPAATRSLAAWLFALGYVIAVFALSGPAWQQVAQPTFAPQSPLVVVEDMSSHMLVADLPPSRALRERLKVQQLIDARSGGQVGLVAYAGDAFTVAPISDDAHSLDDLVVALTPDTMPLDGQRADLALRRAADLLAQAGYTHGRILVLTDAADAQAQQAAREVRAKGYTVDVLGVGTASGAPLPSAGGRFVTDVQGSPQVARLDEPSLRELASAGGGRYAPISAADADLRALDVLTPRADAAVGKASADVLAWRDDGPWLVLILLPLAALAFRRGWLAAVLLVGMLALPTPPAQAAPQGAWQGWWTRADQRADRALRAGDANDAVTLAQTPAQRAAAAYLKGDYAAAADGWSHLNDADAAYNRGNALAQMGRYDQAISAWQAALKQQPSMTDAQANIDAVRKLLAQRKPPPQQGQHSAKQKEQGKDRGKDQQKSQAQGKQPDQQTAQGQHDDAQAQSKQASQSQQPQSQQQSQQQQAQQQQAQEQAQQQHSSQRQQPSPRQNASSQQDASAQSAQPKPDAAAQARAQAAEKQALQQALASRRNDGKPLQSPALVETTAQREQRQANQQIIQRVPDEPGALLKRKFWLEYQRRLQGDSP